MRGRLRWVGRGFKLFQAFSVASSDKLGTQILPFIHTDKALVTLDPPRAWKLTYQAMPLLSFRGVHCDGLSQRCGRMALGTNGWTGCWGAWARCATHNLRHKVLLHERKQAHFPTPG